MNLYLFHTVGCHLCELAEAELAKLPASFNINIIYCDIAESNAWMNAYDVRIPVIKIENKERDMGWPFTAQDIASYLNS